ncbi:MAG: ceramidase domain-containing protein [Methylococcales bacterium]|nr:ceramidase domain-containing protein [Methylococcales bacterium]
MLEQKHHPHILIFIASIAVMAMLFFDRIPQDPAYHQFADTRQIAGIANFWNVFSNVPFLLAGGYGLWRWKYIIARQDHRAYIVLCIGVLLVSVGSAYYHYAPSTATLLWDRLPMTMAFMALFSLLLDERVIPREQSLTLVPLLIMGIGSAVYWYWSETRGAGDLRPYALVQFLPLVLIPLILWLFESSYLKGRLLVTALGFYVLAKLCEHFDRQLFELLGVISGHTMKHFLAGIASLCIIVAIPRRQD